MPRILREKNANTKIYIQNTQEVKTTLLTWTKQESRALFFQPASEHLTD